MALAQDRMTKRRAGDRFNDPVAEATTIYTGALVVLDASGNAAPGSPATGLKARGLCTERADNSNGAAGDISVETEAGVFLFANSAGVDEIDRTHIKGTAYIVDDETVAATDGSSSRSAAGVIEDVDDAGVWVRIGA
ncbi:hypothetical protein [Gilvimarinus agarilyticus]|uniref:hypothetical protein n=1 Tax=Gilvimarinus agarilyticus TaxID=679259 RepID=UPI0005A2D047|nr:hypothetical protein [Gilvimarinus agarilyticus]